MKHISELDKFVEIEGWSALTFHFETQLFFTCRSRQWRDLMFKYKLRTERPDHAQSC